MSEIPSSLTQCKEPRDMKLGEYLANTVDLAKATGMDQTCVKESELHSLDMGASGSVSAGWGMAEAGFEASLTKIDNKMKEVGCGQFAMNINTQMNAMKDINCTIRNNQSSVSTSQVAGNSITLQTLPRTSEEEANLAKLNQDLIELKKQTMMIFANPNLSKDTLDMLLKLNKSNIEDTKALIKSYSRDIDINKSNIIQSVVQRQSGTISIDTVQTDEIVRAQKVIAKTTAENKLAQELGVNALSPNSKSLINNTVENSTLLSNTNVQNTINSIKLEQKGSNTITLISAGNININESSITQTIVQDLVIKTLISNATKAGVQLASQIVTESTSSLLSDGKSEGADALRKEIGDAREKAIKGAKVPPSGGAIFAVILVLLFVVGFGAIKSTGNLMMNNAVFIIAIVAIVTGIIFLSKEGAGNKILGVIIIITGLAGLGFGVMLRMRAKAMPLQFRFD